MKILWRTNGTFLCLLGALFLLPWADAKLLVFGLPLYLPEVAIFAAFIGALSESLWTRRLFLLPDRVFVLGVPLFLGGAALSFLANPFSLTGLGMLKSWFFFPTLFGYLLWREITSPARQRWVLMLWLTVVTGIAARSLFLALSGAFTYDGRLAGDYASPNFLAFILAGAVPVICFFLVFRKKRESSQERFLDWILGGALGVILFALFLTHSYGAWLGVAGALTILSGCYFSLGLTKKRATFFLFLGIALLVAFLALESGSAKWQALTEGDPRSSLASRAMIWQAATKILLDHPLFGVGPGRFQAVYLEYQPFFPPYLEWAVPEPHNIFLAVALGTGALGLIGLLLFSGRLAVLLWKSTLSAALSAERRYSILMLSLLATFFLMGLGDTPFFKNDLALQFFLFLALALPQPQQKE